MRPDGKGGSEAGPLEWVAAGCLVMGVQAAMVCGCSLVTQVHSVGRTTDERDVGRTDSRFVCSFSVKSAAGGLCHQVQPSLAGRSCRQPDSPSVRPLGCLSPRLPAACRCHRPC